MSPVCNRRGDSSRERLLIVFRRRRRAKLINENTYAKLLLHQPLNAAERSFEGLAGPARCVSNQGISGPPAV